MTTEGRWLRRVPPPHRCALPTEPGIWNGSVWQCSCGRTYEVVGTDPLPVWRELDD